MANQSFVCTYILMSFCEKKFGKIIIHKNSNLPRTAGNNIVILYRDLLFFLKETLVRRQMCV